MRGKTIGKLINQTWGLPSNASLQEIEGCLQALESHRAPSDRKEMG